MENFNAGVLGGIFGTLLSHPIDTTRILIQTQKPIHIKSLYKGITPPLIGVGLEKGIVFGTFYKLENSRLNDFQKGLISGLLSTFVVSPMEKMKIQLQTNQLKNISRIKNIYSGWSATLFREVPGYGIYFSTYEKLKNEKDTSFDTFYKGGLSGCAAWSVIYPADYIKTMVQNNNITYKEVFSTIRQNPLKIYTGFNYALMRCFPLHGGVFLGHKLYSIDKKSIE